MSRSAPPIIRLARLGRGRAEGAGEGGFCARFKVPPLFWKRTSRPLRDTLHGTYIIPPFVQLSRVRPDRVVDLRLFANRQ